MERKMKQPQSIIISLPVTNLSKSIDFYKAIGFTQKEQMSGDKSAYMILSNTISVMLLTHSMWQQFTTRLIPDAKKMAQVGFILSRDNKHAVDTFVESGVKAGGKADPNPIEDHGFMYGRGLEDPDGHIWEAKWMDISAMIQTN
jgi:hypothetical protein